MFYFFTINNRNTYFVDILKWKGVKENNRFMILLHYILFVYITVEILDNFPLKPSLYCASNNNELEEHNFGHRENLVKSFQIHNAERHHETTAFSQYTGHDSGIDKNA